MLGVSLPLNEVDDCDGAYATIPSCVGLRAGGICDGLSSILIDTEDVYPLKLWL